ncbi:DUF4112 domain-containing protein [Sphingobacterium daejeonense]|jgi:hypothetical protein|uniref:DUF4112 domain-containing protein n=1 Tax=Sphingobacterium daejeonense TaxID=371142 RepID=A0ABW3RGM6_9SPHI|nr:MULTISPECIES: DUF4112 domain-containing protein [Sphingobacterium]VTP86178.1 Uncharacterised protein [Sphingobacterium daejeonense]
MENRSTYNLEKIDKDFQWVKRLSVLMDSRFRIGNFRFGLDPILNFIPFGGQIATFIISLVLVSVMYRNGASSKVAVKMLLNVTWDALIGSIPLFGNVFDFFNKANEKNIKLLKEHYYDNKHQGSAKRILITLGLVLFILIVLFIYAMYALTVWLMGLIF